jgi:hypothetical protein
MFRPVVRIRSILSVLAVLLVAGAGVATWFAMPSLVARFVPPGAAPASAKAAQPASAAKPSSQPDRAGKRTAVASRRKSARRPARTSAPAWDGARAQPGHELLSRPPGPLHARAASDTELALSWGPSPDPENVVGYEVVRDGSVVASAVWPSGFVTGLSPATEYCFAVRAIGAEGDRSPTSPRVCQRTLAGAPLQTAAAPSR